jgi:hypothetical protein
MLTTDGREFEFPEPGPQMFHLTCINHPLGRWSTKNPVQRSIHWLGWMDAAGHVSGHNEHPVFGWRECDCTYYDLRVVEGEEIEPEELSRKEHPHLGL